MLAVKSLMLVFMLLMPTIAMPFTLVSAQTMLGINVQTDSNSYCLGQTVNLFGNFTLLGQPVSNGTVGVAVYDSAGEPVAFRTVKTGSGSPPRYLVDFVSLTPCDETGAAQSSFLPGQTLYVMVTFINNDDVSHFVMVPITVFDANGVPLMAQPDSYGTLAAGTTGAMLFMVSAIPSWAQPGNATLVASIFSGYPQDGGTPYCEEDSVNFEINRNPDVNYSTPLPTTAQTPNGTFASSFKLSPQSRPGSYTVDVSAQSTHVENGSQSLSTIQSSTVFSVIYAATPPQAAFTFYPVNSYVNMSITFDASASTAEGYNITIASYQWDFGDGSPEVNTTNSVITHTFAVVGNYLVTLNVTDSQGLWCTASKDITILPPTGPIADFTWSPVTPMPGNATTFDASSTQLGWNGTAQPPIVNYVWNFGDGNVTSSGANPTIVHTYAALGNYTVTLNVTDASGFNSTVAYIVKVQSLRLLGDVLGDGVVDIYDAIALAAAFNSHGPNYAYPGQPASPNWNPNADFLGTGLIDIYDAIILSECFGDTLATGPYVT